MTAHPIRAMLTSWLLLAVVSLACGQEEEPLEPTPEERARLQAQRTAYGEIRQAYREDFKNPAHQSQAILASMRLFEAEYYSPEVTPEQEAAFLKRYADDYASWLSSLEQHAQEAQEWKPALADLRCQLIDAKRMVPVTAYHDNFESFPHQEKYFRAQLEYYEALVRRLNADVEAYRAAKGDAILVVRSLFEKQLLVDTLRDELIVLERSAPGDLLYDEVADFVRLPHREFTFWTRQQAEWKKLRELVETQGGKSAGDALALRLVTTLEAPIKHELQQRQPSVGSAVFDILGKSKEVTLLRAWGQIVADAKERVLKGELSVAQGVRIYQVASVAIDSVLYECPAKERLALANQWVDAWAAIVAGIDREQAPVDYAFATAEREHAAGFLAAMKEWEDE